MTDRPLIQVEASPTFNRNLRTLAKKYRSIKNDIQPIIEQLEQGELPGDQISGIGYAVFKLRVRNSDTQKGKSGGYRLIYYVKTATGIILLTVYIKSDKSILQPQTFGTSLQTMNNGRSTVKGISKHLLGILKGEGERAIALSDNL